MVTEISSKRNKCPICYSLNKNRLFNEKLINLNYINFANKHLSKTFNKSLLKKQNFTIIECLDCFGFYQERILKNKFNRIYYDKLIDQNHSLQKKKNYIKLNLKKIIYEINNVKNFLKTDKKDLKILEFGAGWGHWSLALKMNNFNVEAIENSNIRFDYIKKNKINAYKEIKNLKKKYHLIYSDQTFEHLNDPNKILKLMRKILVKNGIIILKVPSAIFLKKKLTRDYKIIKDEMIPFEHINAFIPKTWKKIALNNNLQIIYPWKFTKILSFYSIRRTIVDIVDFILGKKIIMKKND